MSIDFLKKNYVNKENFDKRSFFFLTHRSETAGVIYINKVEEEYIAEYFCVNPKHVNKV